MQLQSCPALTSAAVPLELSDEFVEAEESPFIPTAMQSRKAHLRMAPLRIEVCDTISTSPRAQTSRAAKAELKDSEGRLFQDVYEDLEDILGHGTFCVVHRGRQKIDCRDVALKIMRTDDLEMHQVSIKEFNLLARMQHPHIVQSYALFLAQTRVVLALEYISGQPLSKAIASECAGHFHEAIAQVFFTALMSAIVYIHAMNVAHRDVKDSNVLVWIASLDLRLIDFNSALDLDTSGAEPLTPLAGTSFWAEPKVLLGSHTCPLGGDIWSAGLCLHLMLAGQLPAPHLCEATRAQLAHHLLQIQDALDSSEWEWVSDDCRSLLKLLLKPDPRHRPSAHEAFLQPWLQVPTLAAPIAEAGGSTCAADGEGCEPCRNHVQRTGSFGNTAPLLKVSATGPVSSDVSGGG